MMPVKLEALDRLELEALGALMPEAHTCEGDGYLPYLGKACDLARDHGFEPVGAGSSRFAVELGEVAGRPAVAKLAYTAPGLVHNLQEAVFSLAFPPHITRHLTPCLLLTPTLVLIQERVEVVGPPLIELLTATPRKRRELERQQDIELKRYEREILKARTVLTRVNPDSTKNAIRPDNYGIRNSGEVVAMDYGEWWHPIEPAWAWVLRQLEQGPLRLDFNKAKRAWLAGELLEALETRLESERPTLMTLVNRAGLWPADSDPCPCGEDAYGQCFRRDPEECSMGMDAADFMRLKAMYVLPPPACSRPPMGVGCAR